MKSNILIKTAINYHISRVCNFKCKFCFHTNKNNFMLSIEQQLKLIEIFRNAGAEKINFAGGEPFLFPDVLGELVRGSKLMGYNSVSIISNGSKVKRNWFEKYGEWLDIIGISCDTLDPIINYNHGRCVAGSSKPKDETVKINEISEISKEFGILFKINTVVTKENKNEDMSKFINKINPMRWKVFQVLPIKTENYGDSFNKIIDLEISKEEFDNYVNVNRKGLNFPDILVPEDNNTMRNSYILIDEYGRFLDCSNGSKTHTSSVLDVGLDRAIEELISSNGGGFDKEMFEFRGGYYPEKWTKINKL